MRPCRLSVRVAQNARRTRVPAPERPPGKAKVQANTAYQVWSTLRRDRTKVAATSASRVDVTLWASGLR